MKIIKNAINLMCLFCLISIAGCKKDKDTTTAATPAPAVDKLCNGNGSTSYYPFVNANQWTYSYSVSSTNPVIRITGTQTFLSKVFFVLRDDNSLYYTGDVYFREDATTHNIYTYDTSTHLEYLEVPGSPSLNQTWTNAYGQTCIVADLNASINSGYCSYTGLLKIIVGSSNTRYYKKGLGLVYDTESSFPATIMKLKTVTLN